SEVPSPLIGKPAPEFTLPLLYHSAKSLSRKELLGAPYLLNVFGSWCPTCQDEHPILTNQIKPLGIKLVGLDWKTNPTTPSAGSGERAAMRRPALRCGTPLRISKSALSPCPLSHRKADGGEGSKQQPSHRCS